ncbi:MAG: hypothetical protein M1822_009128 [Bathelium mastoideum]|nr:MAG: hypothetical protein M1822_009128 [Bathelium mastoideum]
MAISRLQASLAAATNDVTVAAANINFDFTLVKCEVPKEFEDLGKALSTKRREQAETGSLHITARRLGALFEGVCPPTPNLIRAYGIRASEIAETAKKTSLEPANSIFAAHTGADATSIWAAATSSALHVQLLACMLARIWTAAEATSIWFELVKERRKNIVVRYDEGEALRFSTLTAAAQTEISRSSLADWDSSARSWLRTADRMKTKEQQQLMLIIANVNIPINKDMTVLSSVTAAWKSALETMENIVGGMPQAVNSGPALLALSSWHLYPDLLMVGHDSGEVRFRDPLVSPGGMLTVGLARSTDEDTRGVYWSLSLAHMNFYGHPISTNARLSHESAKVSFPHFVQAVFGSLLGKWIIPGSEIDPAARFFASFQAAVERFAESDPRSEQTQNAMSFLRDSTHWWNIMAQAARAYLERNSEEKDTIQKLTRLGLKRSSAFIPETGRHPFFGFLDRNVILDCLKGNEERISFLRFIASGTQMDPNQPLIIRYFDDPQQERAYERIGHFATTKPLPIPLPQKRKRTSDISDSFSGHHRWLEFGQKTQYPGETISLGDSVTFRSSHDYSVKSFYFQGHQYAAAWGNPKTAAIFQKSSLPAQFLREATLEDLIRCLNKDMFSIDHLLSHLKHNLDPLSQVTKTMVAISVAAKFYKVLPNATVSIANLAKPLSTSAWAETISSRPHVVDMNGLLYPAAKAQHSPPSRHIALSCIAYMESGYNIDPNLLTNVLALAYEDSIYIAMQLTCDPWEEPEPYEFKRILGNIGRPGLTLLVPPQNPIQRPSDPGSWKVIGDKTFDGHPEDRFKKTSLHLSFTEYYVPLYQNTGHGQDSQIHFLESVISVHDSGAWIGDVNILQALQDSRVHRMGVFSCGHKSPTTYGGKMVSVESWEDILDPAEERFVIRANGNWVARLAATAILTQSLPDPSSRLGALGGDIVICPNSVCWMCNDPNPPTTSPIARGLSSAFIY